MTWVSFLFLLPLLSIFSLLFPLPSLSLSYSFPPLVEVFFTGFSLLCFVGFYLHFLAFASASTRICFLFWWLFFRSYPLWHCLFNHKSYFAFLVISFPYLGFSFFILNFLGSLIFWKIQVLKSFLGFCWSYSLACIEKFSFQFLLVNCYKILIFFFVFCFNFTVHILYTKVWTFS